MDTAAAMMEASVKKQAPRPSRASAAEDDSVAIPTDPATARAVARYMLDPRRALTGRRAPYYLGLTVVWSAFRGLVRAGMALDDVLYPEHRSQPIVAPTFIFANARSGTTLLHRLLSLDSERFVAPKLYQSLFPAVTLHRIFAALGRADRRLGGRLEKLVDWIDERYLSGWEGIHEIRLDREEEDEGPWLYTLLSPTITLLFPDVDRFERAEWLDRLEPEARARFMRYYESVIQRLLCAEGGDRSYLNKNVMFAHRVRSVLEHFPDARFIYLVRHPYDALGSMLQMWYVAWAAHSPEVSKDSPQSRAMAQLAVDYYRYALDLRSFVPEEQLFVVRFDDLVREPKGTVERIYAHFGLPVSDAFRVRLAEATLRAGRFKSRGHEYALEDFGLPREEVHRQLRDLFEEFGFEP